MEQKTERFIEKLENVFASGKVSITEFEMLIKDWRRFISIQCFEEDDDVQIHSNLNHLKLTVQWYRKHGCSDKSEDLLKFLRTMIQCINVELQGLKLKTRIEKRTSDISGTFHNTMVWTANKRALIELISALHSVNCINGGKIKIQRLVELFEGIFEINLSNYFSELNKMMVRTPVKARGLRAYFLSDLVDGFNQKMQNFK